MCPCNNTEIHMIEENFQRWKIFYNRTMFDTIENLLRPWYFSKEFLILKSFQK